MTRNYQLPQGRRVHMFRSGDVHFEGVKINYNPNLYKKQEKFLDEIQQKIPFSGAVRSIHTPKSGTEVTDFRNLERDAKYVAAGPKGFISIRGGYDNIGKPIRRSKKEANPERVVKSKNFKRSKKIWVYQNGNEKTKAIPFKISGQHNEDFSSFIYRVSEGVKMPGGGVGKIFDLKGKIIDSMEELEYNGNYVASLKNDLFRPLDYTKIGKDFSRNQLREEDENDGVKSPGMKLRMPKSTKFKAKRSRSLPQNDALGSTPEISPRRRRSRSKRKKKGWKSRRASSNDDQTGGESDDIESPLQRNKSQDPSNKLSIKSQNNSPLKGILKHGEERTQSPSHFYETLSKLEITDGDIKKRNGTDDEGDSNSHEEEDHSDNDNDDDDGDDGDDDDDDNEDDDGSQSEEDSGRGSIFKGEEDRIDSLFRAKHKSRPSTTVSVDLDADEGGIFRAKSKSGYGKGAKTVLEDKKLKVDLPVDLLEPKEVMEEVY